MSDETLPVEKKRDLLDHSDEQPEPYPVKRDYDMTLLDYNIDNFNQILETDKWLSDSIRRELYNMTGALLGIGKDGEKFQQKSAEDQYKILGDMANSPTPAGKVYAYQVGMEYAPPIPTGPTGPAFAPTLGGPGMGGGMRPVAPQPAPPGYYPPQMPYGTPPVDPYTGHPVHGQPPYNPYGAPPAYPQGSYPPQHDPQHMAQYQGYAQPHAYPSYPVPPNPQQPGYGGYPGQPPQSQPPYPPQSGQPTWPPQQPPGPSSSGHPTWPPAQPIIVEAEEVKDTPPSSSDDNSAKS